MTTRILITASVLLLLVGSAHATYLFDWSSPTAHMFTTPDPTGDTTPPGATGADITALMWARDLNNTYFRMDLLDGFPGTSLYGIYVHDSASGATAGSNFNPLELDSEGLTYFTTMQRNADFVVFSPNPLRYDWNSGTSSFDVTNNPANGITFQASPYPTYNVPGTITLEWQIPNSQLPSQYAFWGATMGYSSGNRQTVDITAQANTPEPATLALLGIGLSGLWFKRRRKA